MFFSLLLSRCARAANTDYDEVARAFETCGFALPEELAWPRWLADHDMAIRARLGRGEEDTLVNFVLLGVSFTAQPRVMIEALDASLIAARVRDFVSAVHSPGHNARLISLRRLLDSQTQPPELWVNELVSRRLAEQRKYRAALDRAPANAPASAQFFQHRGLSLDTGFRPNWAIDRTLADLKRRGVLTSVRRAAVIGPGLDFTDKDSGFDYYPLQTLQPFALADSLLRHGLSTASDLRIGVFDISTETLDCIARTAHQPCTLQLVLDAGRAWDPAALAYWRRFGDHIGNPSRPLPAPPQVRNVLRRAVSIRPQIVKIIEPMPLNIVTEHARETYDLVIATNILVYYDAFDRALALLNIASMMMAAGAFLANSPLPACPALPLHATGSVDVRYSSAAGDDDRIEIYSNSPLTRPLAPQ